jgi:serine/threonine-protein kinase RsbW
LVSTTAAVDDGLVGWSAMRRFIEFDSGIVGRDVVIEDAKTLLCESYGISRGEAFAILRSVSSHSNRKLRDVAEKLVAESLGRSRGTRASRRFIRVAPRAIPAEVGGTTHTPAGPASFELRLPCEVGSVPQGRARVRDWCHELGLGDEAIADIQLAFTEAAANAVRHSGCDEFEVRAWTGDGCLTVSVWDQGHGLRAGDPGGAGLGIRIIRALAGSVDFEATESGTRVTMRFPLTGPRRAPSR